MNRDNVPTANRKPKIENRKSMVPLRFIPFLRPMVWGGRRLAGTLGKPLAGPEPYGESWEVSDHPLHRSVTATGPFAGRSLRDLMERDREVLLGTAAAAHAVFPWLIKFLDAHDWLSLQVHPDEQAVKGLWPGEGSKTEAWFVIDAMPGSRVYAGLLPGVDEARLRAALAAGTAADCLHSFTPRPGDCVFLPAGTVHAVGGGVLMAEVQQTSDATFRLFDWNRRDAQGKARALHIEEGLASIHWDQGPVRPVRAKGASGVQPLVRCPYFVMEYLAADEPFACGGTGRLQALIVLRGRARLEAPGAEEMATGQAWLLPAGMARAWCRPEPGLAALRCTLLDPGGQN
jgi:mannose-6-phosphate isomerase